MECSNFSEIIERAVGLLQGSTAQKIADGEITDAELDQLQGELEAILAGIEYERECRDTARQSAAVHNSDKNRAEKVSTDAADYVNKLEI